MSEAIKPLGDAFDTGAMSQGEPGLPSAFRWNDRRLTIAHVTATRRGLKVDRGDTYLKRRWYDVLFSDGSAATIYFDRGARARTPRWWLYSIDEGSENELEQR